MNLPSGAYCEVREKSTDADGRLLIVVHSWDSEADRDAAPDAPHSVQHHRIGPRMKYMRRPGEQFILDGTPRAAVETDDLHSQIINILTEKHAPGTRAIEPSAHIERGTDDRWGYLAHPHVVALGVQN